MERIIHWKQTGVGTIVAKQELFESFEDDEGYWSTYKNVRNWNKSWEVKIISSVCDYKLKINLKDYFKGYDGEAIFTNSAGKVSYYLGSGPLKFNGQEI